MKLKAVKMLIGRIFRAGEIDRYVPSVFSKFLQAYVCVDHREETVIYLHKLILYTFFKIHILISMYFL